MELFLKLLIICPLLFVAGVIDGIAGGGGIIALPTYLMSGLPISVAYGCNKMQSCIGTAAGLTKYIKNGFTDVKIALLSSVTAIAGSFISTKIMLSLDDMTKSIIIMVAMCFILTLTLLIHKLPSGEQKQVKPSFMSVVLCFIIGMVLGLYDGFFGPGGGTVALMLFCLIFKYDVRTATGNGKLIIVISNLIALISYIRSGNILYSISIPATIANVAGSYLGACLAVKNGKKLVNKLLTVVITVILIQSLIKLIA